MTYTLHNGDCLEIMPTLAAGSVDAVICDPPAGIAFMGRGWDAFDGHTEPDAHGRKARAAADGKWLDGRGTSPYGFSRHVGSAGRDPFIAWLAERLSAARRVLKPGHYALVWALPRTSHWTGMACEDAGFVVIDRIAHLFGSGFPKGKNKLKPAVEDWWLIRAPGPAAALHIDACRVGHNENLARVNGGTDVLSWGGTYGAGANTAAQRQANGQPALGRWPANLVLSHAPGCIPNGVKRVRGGGNKSSGSLNGQSTGKHTSGGYAYTTTSDVMGYADADGRETVSDFACVEGCPVRELGEMSGESSTPATYTRSTEAKGEWLHTKPAGSEQLGYGDTGTAARYFPNLDPPEWECAPGCPIAALDEQSGELTSGELLPGHKRGDGPNGHFNGGGVIRREYGGDTGGASRFYPNLDPPFYYSAKASRRERGAGCDNLYWLADDTRGSGYRPITRAEYDEAQAAGERVARGNMHPTVKNIKLLSWLINLLTVPGDVILDPFAGSGSIGVAALMGGREFVGVEMDPDYLSICERRLAEAAATPRQLEIAV